MANTRKFKSKTNSTHRRRFVYHSMKDKALLEVNQPRKNK